MLLRLDDEIKAAYQNAANAAECAKACLLPEKRDAWLTLESGYLLLARTLVSFAVARPISVCEAAGPLCWGRAKGPAAVGKTGP
jgi:hypothetical protein